MPTSGTTSIDASIRMRPRNQRDSGSSWVAITVCSFVTLGGVLLGYYTGTIGGALAMETWLKEFGHSVNELGDGDLSLGNKSLIVSILSVGSFFGALKSAQVVDSFGRKYGIMISVAVFTIGVIFQTAASQILMLIIGRLVAGWGVGLLSAQVPMYQSETSPRWIRGTLVGSYQLSIALGLLLASCANKATHSPGSSDYRLPLALQFIWAGLLFLGMIFLPETPRFLIKRDRMDDARKSLSILRRLPVDHPEIISEANEIKANHEYEMSLGPTSYKVLFSNGSDNMRKRLLTGIGIQLLQQLTGANFIFYYGSSFFTSLGVKDSLTISLITNSVNVGATIPALWLVEEWGRRNLLLFGAAGMFVCQFVVAIVGTLFSQAEMANNIMITFICAYVFLYAFSWGPISWIVTGEIFPLKSRAKGMGTSTAANWLLNWLLGYTTPMLVDSGAGKAGLGVKVFFIWGTFCALSFLFAWTCVYETKGFTLEQIDELYAKVPNAWRSADFEPTVNFADVAQEVHQDDYMSSETRLTLAEIEASVLRRRNSTSSDPIEIRIEVQESEGKLTEVEV